MKIGSRQGSWSTDLLSLDGKDDRMTLPPPGIKQVTINRMIDELVFKVFKANVIKNNS